LFQLEFHINGTSHYANAEVVNGVLWVDTDGQRRQAKNENVAVQLAADFAAPFLRSAEQKSQAWGLKVAIAGNSASYGQWNLGGVVRIPVGGMPAPADSPVSLIRARYHDNGPTAALANAEQILRAYLRQAA
jgi:hypothetical protein